MPEKSTTIIIQGDAVQATPGANGLDLRVTSDIVISHRKVTMAATGVRLSMPEGWCALVLPRSGLSRAGVVLVNSPGLIDSDYRGEIMAMLTLGSHASADELELKAGARVAQLLFLNQPHFHLLPGAVSDDTDRGSKGFGSTGVS